MVAVLKIEGSGSKCPGTVGHFNVLGRRDSEAVGQEVRNRKVQNAFHYSQFGSIFLDIS